MDLNSIYIVWFLNNDYQNLCQERVQAATEQNHQKETLSINQKIKKEEIKKDKKQQFANDQQQINPIQKRKPKDFGITYEVSKRIKDVEMKKEINFEHLESEILEMEKNVVTNKELKFAFAQPTN